MGPVEKTFFLEKLFDETELGELAEQENAGEASDADDNGGEDRNH